MPPTRLLRNPARILALGLTALAVSLVLSVEALERGVLDRPLPFANADRLVAVERVSENTAFGLSWPEIEALRSRTDLFSGVTAYAGQRCDLLQGSVATSIGVVRVQPGFFNLMGIAPITGRVAVPTDQNGIEEAPAVVVTRAVWEKFFGTAPDVIGRPIRVNCGDLPQTFEVVAVVENDQALRRERPYGMFLVQSPPPNERLNWRGGWFRTVARLAAGVAPEQANAAVGVFIPQLIQGHIQTPYAGRAVDLKQSERRDQQSTFTLLRSAVVSLFAMGLVNIVLLGAADAQRRSREFALRSAIGADRWHLIRQGMSESAAFTLPASVGSLVLAFGTLIGLKSIAPGDLPYVDTVTLALVPVSLPVLLTALVFAATLTAPLFAAFRTTGTLRVVSIAPTRRSWRDELLIGCQVLLVSGMLVYVGLALTGFWRRYAAPLGFDPVGVTAFKVTTDRSVWGTADRFDGLLRNLQNELSGIEGASGVALTDAIVPAIGAKARLRRPDGARLDPRTRWVGPGFFDTLRVPIIAGRDIRTSDADGGLVVVNDRLARSLASSPSAALGLRLAFSGSPQAAGWTIVGVVRDMRDGAPEDPPEPTVYVPLAKGRIGLTVLVRATDANVAASVEKTVASLVPGVSVTATALVDHLAGYRRQLAFYLVVLTTLASAALAVAALGILAITTHMVGVRTREIAVRFAIGGSPQRVIGRVLGRSIILTAIGLAGGQLLGWALLSFAAAELVNETQALRPFIWAVPIPVAFVAIAATAPAIIRLVKVQPAILLRE